MGPETEPVKRWLCVCAAWTMSLLGSESFTAVQRLTSPTCLSRAALPWLTCVRRSSRPCPPGGSSTGQTSSCHCSSLCTMCRTSWTPWPLRMTSGALHSSCTAQARWARLRVGELQLAEEKRPCTTRGSPHLAKSHRIPALCFSFTLMLPVVGVCVGFMWQLNVTH